MAWRDKVLTGFLAADFTNSWLQNGLPTGRMRRAFTGLFNYFGKQAKVVW